MSKKQKQKRCHNESLDKCGFTVCCWNYATVEVDGVPYCDKHDPRRIDRLKRAAILLEMAKGIETEKLKDYKIVKAVFED